MRSNVGAPPLNWLCMTALYLSSPPRISATWRRFSLTCASGTTTPASTASASVRRIVAISSSEGVMRTPRRESAAASARFSIWKSSRSIEAMPASVSQLTIGRLSRPSPVIEFWKAPGTIKMIKRKIKRPIRKTNCKRLRPSGTWIVSSPRKSSTDGASATPPSTCSIGAWASLGDLRSWRDLLDIGAVARCGGTRGGSGASWSARRCTELAAEEGSPHD